MAVTQREEINPGLPSKKTYLVRLSNSGQNWYLRVRVNGRYLHRSLKTKDLKEARQRAVALPPDASIRLSVSLKRALLDFQESRQQLIDAPLEQKSIRLNTFKIYKARVASLIHYFDYLGAAKKENATRLVSSLKASDFSGYRYWREKSGIMLTTIKTEISQINTILSWLHENDYIDNKIVLKLPRVDIDKFRPANRLLTTKEKSALERALNKLCNSGDKNNRRNWQLYRLWLKWLEETFTRPHESRMLKIQDVKEICIGNKIAVQFYTSSNTKTGRRLVYAASRVKSDLIAFYNEWNIAITRDSHLFILPSTKKSPSVSWFAEKWKHLLDAAGLTPSSRELTQYSLRHEGINTLLMQGVPASKVADLAGHSLSIQQRIYKKYQLENDHSVLRDQSLSKLHQAVETKVDADIPYPWEIDQLTGQWFPDDYLESIPDNLNISL